MPSTSLPSATPGFDPEVPFEAAAAFDHAAATLAAMADPARGAEMSRYMRGLFPYLGIGSPERRRATRAVVRAARDAPPAAVVDFAERCWAAPERELQYVATDALREARFSLRPGDLQALRTLITSKSWWDTIDAIAPWALGSLVERHPELVADMDRWVADDDIWIARSAVLHQLRYGERTDADRLYRYCLHVGGSDEFFLRKAAGWALRQYARVDPDGVGSFVTAHESELSPLTRREALKHVAAR